MKFILRLLIILILGYFAPFFPPWWPILVIGFATGVLLPGNGFNLFNAGFLGGGLVWLGLSFKIDLETEGILSEKIVQLFPFSDPTLLLIAAGLIGALCGGLSALSGNSFRKIFMKRPQKSLYS